MDREWRYCSIKGFSEAAPEGLRLFLWRIEVLMHHGYGYWVHHICLMPWHLGRRKQKQLGTSDRKSPLPRWRHTSLSVFRRRIQITFMSVLRSLLFISIQLATANHKYFHGVHQDEDGLLTESWMRGRGSQENMTHVLQPAIVTICWQRNTVKLLAEPPIENQAHYLCQ